LQGERDPADERAHTANTSPYTVAYQYNNIVMDYRDMLDYNPVRDNGGWRAVTLPLLPGLVTNIHLAPLEEQNRALDSVFAKCRHCQIVEYITRDPNSILWYPTEMC
jgi:hypothetical protein